MRASYLASEIAKVLKEHETFYGHRKCPLKGKLHLHVRKSEVDEALRLLRRKMPRIRRERHFIVDPGKSGKRDRSH